MVRRENLRAAVFLWTTPLATPRASSGCIAVIAAEAALSLPVATVRNDGRVTVNGESLDPSDTSAAVERCRRMLAAGG